VKGQIQIAGETVEFTNVTKYSTAAEAIAFREGVEYANDSALTVVGILEHGGDFMVYMFDEDLL
jgi:hypothetical protein